jgi:alkylation response protein AidB-like acyl-CoA dehydrogenase
MVSFDFTLSPRVEEWRDGIARFVKDVVIPREQEAFEHGVTDDLRRDLQSAARAAGWWAPQATKEVGGGGFAFDEAAVLLEEAGYSLLGPMAINCAAPDEGNIHMLTVIATEDQKERLLLPLVAGEIRSCFAMTEPAPGAGSDPAALETVARRTATGWHITGHKHLITGADGADVAIIMARGGNEDENTGATMFLVPMNTPGLVVSEHVRTIDTTTVGGHCIIDIDIEVDDGAVLGEPGLGFRYAQVRLAPARLTHCMRWLGAARRAQDIAVERAVERQIFGARLAELGQAQAMIADNEIDLAAARALLWHSSWQIAQGHKGGEESSRTKVFVSEATSRVVDRSVQLTGGLGVAEELVVGRIYADIRGFRIYDGASEVHKMSIAQRVSRRTLQRLAG